MLVCNYAKGGNIIGTPMYKIGEPCSQCDDGYTCESDLCSKNWTNLINLIVLIYFLSKVYGKIIYIFNLNLARLKKHAATFSNKYLQIVVKVKSYAF